MLDNTLFLFCFPKVAGVVNVLYIEKSINLLISIYFPLFSCIFLRDKQTNEERF